MKPIPVFHTIKTEDLERMILCFHGQVQTCPDQKKLLSYSADSDRIGIILEGSADLIAYDCDGYRSILEHLGEQDIFGNLLLPYSEQASIEIRASGSCRVLLFSYEHLVKRCSNACDCHSQLVSNVLQILSIKSRQLHSRLEILSQRSIRSKLLTYFRQLAAQNNSDSFQLPFTLNSLADYLFIDRSAMLREMKKLREEGIIQSKGRQIRLLPRE